jgi:hypothetical protein
MPLILGTNSIKDTGYDVANSCRFNRGSSDSLERTPSSASNRKTFTFSGWFKLANLASSQSDYYQIFGATVGGGNEGVFISDADDIYIFLGGEFHTNRKFRDPNAFYHVVFAVDTTQSTDTNRVKLYINGVQETSFSSTGYPNQNHDTAVNNTTKQNIGERQNDDYFDGYMAECVLIDGQQLTPTSFGEFDEDSGIWKPIDVSGLTFGSNGFYLDFEDSSALGNDVSGNNNDFTVNNLTAIDQSTDTCTNNFATLNPLASLPNTGVSTFSEGNLVSQGVNGSYVNGGSTFQMTTGKWYAEVKYLATSSDVGRIIIGITQDVSEISRLNQDNGSLNTTYNNYDGAGGKNVQGTGSSYGSDFGLNDIIGIALDLDNEKLYFSVNGTWQNSGVPTSGSTGTGAITGFSSPSSSISGGYFFYSGSNSNAQNNTVSWNFGSPSFSISSGNTDGNGYGNFEYAVPSGYYALNTKNLAEYG